MVNPFPATASEGIKAVTAIAPIDIKRVFNPGRDMTDYRMQPFNPAVPRSRKLTVCALRLECPLIHVPALQRAAGDGPVSQSALLDVWKTAPGKISGRPGRTIRQGPAAFARPV